MKYISKPKVVNAIRFMGEDEGMPDFVSVKGTKLPPSQRVARYWSKLHDSELETQYGDWILYTNDGDRWPCKDSIFQQTYEPYRAPTIEDSTLIMGGMGFR